MFVRQFDEDHLIILGLGESVPVGAEMACEAIRTRKVLVQCEQGMVAAVGDLEALRFLSCLRCCNTWRPSNDLHVLAPIRSTILETSKYFTLVWELHLMNMEDGIKLLKAKHSTKTSVSSDTIITATNFDLVA